MPPATPSSSRSRRCASTKGLAALTPQVLHFSLLRFVYDAKSEDRKKSNAFINFYRVIDMSKWLAPSAANADERVLYDLTAVLDHRGQSAHHGAIGDVAAAD